MKKIVVIPARGGSKRIPRKNIKDFYGKPIISYSLESSKNAGIFDCVHASTEDKEIYEIVSQLGFKPKFYRSDENSADNIGVKDVLVEVVSMFEKQGIIFDIVCLLSATAPLISAEDLKDAFYTFEKSGMKHPMLAVTKYPVPIEWALRFDLEEKFIKPVNSNLFFASSHAFKDAYYDVGSFAYFTRDQLFLSSQDIVFFPYILPQTKSLLIFFSKWYQRI